MKDFKITISFLMLIFIVGCSNEVQHRTLEDMIANAKSQVDAISVEKFKSMIDHGENHIIIDCRQASDFIVGHVPGAINIPRGLLEFSNKISDRRSKIIIYNYDDGGSALCSEALLKLKYHDVSMIENGWNEWSKTYPELFETGEEVGAKADGSKKIETSGGGCGG